MKSEQDFCSKSPLVFSLKKLWPDDEGALLLFFHFRWDNSQFQTLWTPVCGLASQSWEQILFSSQRYLKFLKSTACSHYAVFLFVCFFGNWLQYSWVKQCVIICYNRYLYIWAIWFCLQAVIWRICQLCSDCLYVCKSLCLPAVKAECRDQTCFHSNQQTKFQHDPLSVLCGPSSENNPLVFCVGYAFLLFQDESSVQALIDACIEEDGKLYLCVSSPTIKDKPVSGNTHTPIFLNLLVFLLSSVKLSTLELKNKQTTCWFCVWQVQIRPWNLNDSDFVMDGSQPLDPRKTIFVGGVPRPLRAGILQIYAGIFPPAELTTNECL